MTKGSGTRSGMLWEVERLLNECEELPQILLMENVPQVHGNKNMADFELWISFLKSKGYHNYWQDLNAKDYGIAQNRNRTFMISFLDDVNYKFPKSFPLEKTMKDYLENKVDEKYYINSKKAQALIEKLIVMEVYPSKAQIPIYANYNKCDGVDVNVSRSIMSQTYKGFGTSNQTQNGVIEALNPMPDGTCRTIKQQYFKNSATNFDMQTSRGATGVIESGVIKLGTMDYKQDHTFESANRVYDVCGNCPTIPTSRGGDHTPKVLIKQATNKGYIECEIGGVADLSFPDSKTRRGRVQEGGKVIPSLTAEGVEGIVYLESLYRIRKLTPLECWRLMGFSDEEFHKAEAINSNTQLYKQAGNSIVVDVLENIFKQIKEVMED